MRMIINIVMFLLLPLCLAGQNNLYKTVTRQQADSIRTGLVTLDNDTLRMIYSRDMSNYYSEINDDSSLYYGQQVLLIAKKLGFKLWEANGLYMMGLSFTRFSNYPKALESYTLAKKIAEDKQSERNIPFIMYFTLDGNPHHARLIVLANIVQDFGSLYGFTGDAEKEISTRLEAIKIAESIDDKITQAVAYANLGFIFFSRDNIDSASLLQKKSEQLTRAAGFYLYEGFAYALKGFIAQERLQYDSAEYFFKQGIQLSFERNTYTAASGNYMALGRLFEKKNLPDSSIYYTRMALNAGHMNISKGNQVAIYRALAAYFEIQQEPDSALKYLTLSLPLHDSTVNEEKENLRTYQAMGFDEQLRLQDLEKARIETRNKTRTFVLATGLLFLLGTGIILYRSNSQKQEANRVLVTTLDNLKSTQSQLVQSEKMASLGELTAGIAHEIQNPLNFVNNFSEVNTELIDEMQEELRKGDKEEAIAISNNIKENQEKISHHGKRADAIVKGMLQHSRSSTGLKEPAHINTLADEYLRLSYHGLRAKDKSFNADFETDFDPLIGKTDMVPQEIGRVLLNLFNNAFYAVTEKKAAANADYKPMVKVTTRQKTDRIEVTVSDNGTGIPGAVADKIFQPFFTTKPAGKGTGLGLSLSYDIVKAHGGELTVEAGEDGGSAFMFSLPV